MEEGASGNGKSDSKTKRRRKWGEYMDGSGGGGKDGTPDRSAARGRPVSQGEGCATATRRRCSQSAVNQATVDETATGHPCCPGRGRCSCFSIALTMYHLLLTFRSLTCIYTGHGAPPYQWQVQKKGGMKFYLLQEHFCRL